MTLSQFKQFLLKKITIEKFMTAFDGGLIDLFETDDEVESNIKIKINDNTLNEISNLNLEKKINKSYNNFRKYISNDKIYIDYEYIWDFITMPTNESGIMKENGLNLIIFKNPLNDKNDKIQIICPNTELTQNIFSKNKLTIMLYSENDYFEPIMMYNNDKKATNKKTFLFDYNTLISETLLGNTMNNIINSLLTECSSKPSIPKQFKFKENKHIKDIISIIEKSNDITFDRQIINYNFKTIGIIVKYKNKSAYLPSKPSSILLDKDYHFVDNDKIKFNYDDTVDVLNYISNKFNIPCKPIQLIIENNINVIGIITQTNQSIPIISTEYDDKVHKLEKEPYKMFKYDYYFNDKTVLTMTEEDIERKEIICNLRLEKKFYNCYRNVFKKEINKKENIKSKDQIKNLLSNNKTNELWNDIEKIINNIMSADKVEFIKFGKDLLSYCSNLEDNNSCNILNTEILQIPDVNLVNNKSNNKLYPIKLTDQLIRYNNIQQYILNSNSLINFSYQKYNIKNDEIIILEDNLLKDYFENVELKNINRFIKSYNTHKFGSPSFSEKYKSQFKINYEKPKQNIEDKTIITEKPPITKIAPKKHETTLISNREWKRLTSVSSNKMFNKYNLTDDFVFMMNFKPKSKFEPSQTIYTFIQIYYDYYKKELSIDDVKNKLIEIFKILQKNNYLKTNPNDSVVYERNKDLWSPSLHDIFKLTLRNNFADEYINSDSLDNFINTFIDNNKYYLTDFELYLLCYVSSIPVIIHGGIQGNNKPIYNNKKFNQYDPLYTTFSLSNINKNNSNDIKNNLYLNRNNDKFVYLIGLTTYKISDFYDKNENNIKHVMRSVGNNKNSYVDRIGLFAYPNENIRLSISNDNIKKLINNSINFNKISGYITYIFNKVYPDSSRYKSKQRRNRQDNRK